MKVWTFIRQNIYPQWQITADLKIRKFSFPKRDFCDIFKFPRFFPGVPASGSSGQDKQEVS
jgi:hypothetical protein